MGKQERDCRFDTLKGILIFLVVLGHSLSKLQSSGMAVSRSICYIIYSFHMPAFVFISGFFSKNALKSEQYSFQLVKSLLIPFVFAHLAMWMLTSRSPGELLYPRWTLWYLLSLFFWKYLVVPASKVRCSIVISIGLALLIGLTQADKLLSISRTVTFFPFFLAGYKTSRETIDTLREKTHKAIPIFALLLVLSSVLLLRSKGVLRISIFEMATPYNSTGNMTNIQGLLSRCYAILIGFISTFCLIIIVPDRKTLLTDLGKNTMTIYLGHSFVIVLTQMIISAVFSKLFSSEFAVICISVVLSCLICAILGNPWIATIYNKIVNKVSDYVLINH